MLSPISFVLSLRCGGLAERRTPVTTTASQSRQQQIANRDLLRHGQACLNSVKGTYLQYQKARRTAVLLDSSPQIIPPSRLLPFDRLCLATSSGSTRRLEDHPLIRLLSGRHRMCSAELKSRRRLTGGSVALLRRA